jgi:hypothetical protein
MQTRTSPAPKAGDFKVGDKAVYPARGVAEVVSIEEKDIGGKRQKLLRPSPPRHGRTRSWCPVSNAAPDRPPEAHGRGSESVRSSASSRSRDVIARHPDLEPPLPRPGREDRHRLDRRGGRGPPGSHPSAHREGPALLQRASDARARPPAPHQGDLGGAWRFRGQGPRSGRRGLRQELTHLLAPPALAAMPAARCMTRDRRVATLPTSTASRSALRSRSRSRGAPREGHAGDDVGRVLLRQGAT